MGISAGPSLAKAADGKSTEAAPNFSADIAPIIFQNCVSCHRDGQGAPFALTSYQEVRKRSRLIAEVTKSRYMPPWHAASGDVPIRGDRRLSEEDIATLQAWADGGMKEGNAEDLPPRPESSDGWQAGEPDLVLEMAEPFEVPADGPDIYRNFVIPTDFGEDKWLTVLEFRPRARQSSHHANFVADTTGQAVAADLRDSRPGFEGMSFFVEFQDTMAIDLSKSGAVGGGSNIGIWATGAPPFRLPPGFALKLPRGAAIVIQMHFHPSGKPEREQALIGLQFASEPPVRPITGIQIPPLFGRYAGIDIPSGEKRYVLKDSFTTPIDLDAYGAAGHAHYLAKEMKLTAAFPSGETKTLLWIDRWDFAWQNLYDFASPVRIPAGTRLDAEIVYDNSADNPSNPHDPPRNVRWGAGSESEMGSLSLRVSPVHSGELARLDEALTAFLRRRPRKLNSGATRERIEHLLLERYDKDGDGELDEAERKAWVEELRSHLPKRAADPAPKR